MEEAYALMSDCRSIWSDINKQQKQLLLKKRWLIGLPTSDSEKNQFKEPEFLEECRSLPESMLREDDVFYETVKTRVEESFRAFTTRTEDEFAQSSSQLVDACGLKGRILSCIDALTTKGLYHVARILTGEKSKFEKTRAQMKKIIKKSLQEDAQNQINTWDKNVSRNLSEILDDQRNFQENYRGILTPTIQSHGAAANKVLDELEDLSFDALSAMLRKLRGAQGVIPKLKLHKRGKSRGHLIKEIREISMKMLSELDKGSELPQPLAKAMAVAGLAQKLKLGCQNSGEQDFYQFSSEIRSLQDEIMRAIWLLNTRKIRFQELKTMQTLLGPDSDISNSVLRTAIKKMFIEYLFECSDMDTIPKSLLQSLAMINRSSPCPPKRCLPQEEIEEEVECVLGLSAQTKQIVWDLLPSNEIDQDFADAYMEEQEESDDDDGYDDNNDVGLKNYQSCRFSSLDSDNRAEGFGDSLTADSGPHLSTTSRNEYHACPTFAGRIYSGGVKKLEPDLDSDLHDGIYTPQSVEHISLSGATKTNINDYEAECKSNICLSRTITSSFSPFVTPELKTMNIGNFSSNFYQDTKFIPTEQRKIRNHYVTIQEVCDDTSMVANDLIGHMLEKFNKEDAPLKGKDSSRLKRKKLDLSEEDAGTCDIVKIVEELLPSLPKSGMEKLKRLLDAE